MRKEIADAITHRRTLELRYHGFSRTIEPYAYGRDKGGDEILRCYQIAGGSESGERSGWKLLKVADVFAIHEQEGSFVPRPEYRRNDKAMDFFFCQV